MSGSADRIDPARVLGGTADSMSEAELDEAQRRLTELQERKAEAKSEVTKADRAQKDQMAKSRKVADRLQQLKKRRQKVSHLKRFVVEVTDDIQSLEAQSGQDQSAKEAAALADLKKSLLAQAAKMSAVYKYNSEAVAADIEHGVATLRLVQFARADVVSLCTPPYSVRH